MKFNSSVGSTATFSSRSREEFAKKEPADSTATFSSRSKVKTGLRP